MDQQQERQIPHYQTKSCLGFSLVGSLFLGGSMFMYRWACVYKQAEEDARMQGEAQSVDAVIKSGSNPDHRRMVTGMLLHESKKKPFSGIHGDKHFY